MGKRRKKQKRDPEKSDSLKPTIMDNCIFGLQDLISRPNIPVLLSWVIKNTGTLLKIRPVEFRALFGALVPVLGLG